ncbi:metallophosphoesterase family protein [Lacunimicrobium album]
MDFHDCHSFSRRAFLRNGALFLTAAASTRWGYAGLNHQEPLRIGLVTDLHYADKAPAGTRHYRETLSKLADAAKTFAEAKPAFVVELGDLIDAADSVEVELAYLKTINDQFSQLSEDRHCVLGNHCVDTLTKEEFLGGVGQEKSYYSFDRGGVHFVLLDACFRSDGQPYGRKKSHWTDANIPDVELEWLKQDLTQTDKPVIVFAHQRLDESPKHSVKNAARVREVLEQSKKVMAVFQGHSHQNDYQEINDIHYCTLVAMVEGSGVESNGYSVLEVKPMERMLVVSGFRMQKSYEWVR